MRGFTYSPETVGHQMTLPTGTLQQLLAGSSLAEVELGSSFMLSGEGIADGARESVGLFKALSREFQGQSAGRAHALLAYGTLIAVQFLRRRGEQPRGRQPRPTT